MKYKDLTLLLTAVVALLSACDNVSVEDTPDTAAATLCYADYQTCVDPILQAVVSNVTCSASACHALGGNGGGFKINQNPATDAEFMVNFFAAKAFANLTTPTQSKLLLEPLQGSFGITGSHGGGSIFPNTSDPCYQTILTWISKQVGADDSPSCGVCTPINVSACGF